MKVLSMFCAVIALLFSGCGEHQGPTSPSAAGSVNDLIPLAKTPASFRGRMDGMTTVAQPACGSAPTIGVSGTGRGTEIGRFSFLGQHCITGQGVFSNGQLTLTAAHDGDERDEAGAVNISYAGTFVPTSTPGIFNLTFDYTITGGTGRFTGATGGGHGVGVQNAIANIISLDYDGTIRLNREHH